MTRSPESIRPYRNADSKTAQVEQMFNAIAPAYDKINTLLSFGLHRRWRKRAAAHLLPHAPQKILDVATGTADMALELFRTLHPQQITGIDLSERMIHIGRSKVYGASLQGFIRLERHNLLSLPWPGDTFDAVTVAFGLRNFEDIDRGLAQMYRVLRPRGRLVILELSAPETFPARQLFTLYCAVAMPLAGRCFSPSGRAYGYLPDTIQAMPGPQAMIDRLQSAGFAHAAAQAFTWGVCTMYTGIKI